MSRLFLAFYLLLAQRLDTPQLVDRVSETYGRLNSLSADFEQISKDSSNQTGHLRGHVYLKSGKKALFQYDSPVRKFDYFDGKYYTTYTPGIQAQRFPIGKAYDDRLVIFQILGNREAPWKDQFPTMVQPKDSPVMNPGNRIARLLPGNKDVPEVLVEVDPSSFLIHRFVSSRADGAQDEFRFTNIKTDRLDDSLFKFTPPPGVEVVDFK